MTGGRVVVLGETGANFAAGMSGGIAFVWDPQGRFPGRCNPEMVELEGLDDEAERLEVRAMIERHLALTGSDPARTVLADWDRSVDDFVKVMPTDYKRVVLRARAAAGETDRVVVEAAD